MRVVRDLSAEEAVKELINELGVKHVRPGRVKVVRTYDSRSTAYARLWGLSKVLQEGLGLKPAYVLEIIVSNFSLLTCQEKIDVLIHEISHIPKTFSGSVRPHNKYFTAELRRLKKLVRGRDDLIRRVCSKLP